MSMDYFYLGPSPCSEDCAQLGEDDFRQKAKKEMNAYMNQLQRMFPDHYENGVSFKIKWEQHDFGTYGEVVACYQIDDEKACDYALNIEHNLPENWDDEALNELKED